MSIMTKFLAVIVGHNSHAQGAFSVSPVSKTEYVFNTSVANAMKRQSDSVLEIDIFFRRPGLGYRREIADVYQRADAFINNSDGATIELHFNAFDGVTIGTETLSSGSRGSLAFAEEVQEELLALYARPVEADRGVRVRGPNERGGASLHSSIHPSILVEPFFGDVTSEALLAKNVGIDTLAEAYVLAAKSYLGVAQSVASLRGVA